MIRQTWKEVGRGLLGLTLMFGSGALIIKGLCIACKYSHVAGWVYLLVVILGLFGLARMVQPKWEGKK